MSPSKMKLGQPKCCRCRHHGLVVPKKGHKYCPFTACCCWKCGLFARKSEVVAFQRGFSNARDKAAGNGGTAAAAAAAAAAASGTRSSAASGTRSSGGLEPPSSLESSVQPPQAPNSFGFNSEQPGPLPFIPFPFADSSLYATHIPGRWQHLPNMLWMMPPPPPPPPAGLFNHQPVFQQAPVSYPAQTALPYMPNYRQYSFGLPPLPQPGTLQLPPPPALQQLPQNDQQAAEV